MKKWLAENIWLIVMILSFILYWLLNIVIVYIVVSGVIAFILIGKSSEKLEMIYFDMVLFIMYIVFALVDLTIIKKDTVHVLVVLLGLYYIISVYQKSFIKKNK